jgi:hypothetical protein
LFRQKRRSVFSKTPKARSHGLFVISVKLFYIARRLFPLNGVVPELSATRKKSSQTVLQAIIGDFHGHHFGDLPRK